MEKIKVNCEMEITIKMIGGKYKALILYFLINDGPHRFNQLQRLLNCSQKTLSNQLSELQNDGLITKTIYPQVPIKVEYSISEKGASLADILEAMCAWGEQNIGDDYELINPQCK